MSPCHQIPASAAKVACLEALEGRRLMSFSPVVSYSTGGSQEVVSADFNNDGQLDLATAGYGNVSVLLGNGDGTFQPAQVSAAANAPMVSMAVGDFDADGNLDIATANDTYSYYPDEDVTVVLGNGDGTFGPAAHYPVQIGYPKSIAVGDVTGDGKLDLVVTADDPYGEFTFSGGYFNTILMGQGDGTFSNYGSYRLTGLPGDPPLSADFNGDGLSDHAGFYLGYSSVSVLLGRAGGSVHAPITTPIEHEARALVEADFNGDGRPDLAAAGGLSVSVLVNDGDWSFPPPAVSISDATVTEGNTGTVNATFTLTLAFPSAVDAVVHYDTLNSTATAGSDYAAASGTLVIPAGQTSRTLTVAVSGDRAVEPSERFYVTLSAGTNASIGDGLGIGTILDNEPRISINNVSKSEGQGKTTTFSFTVSLSAVYDQAVTVNYATTSGTATAGTDYTSKAGSVTFAAGETIKTITVVIKGDKAREANETFFVDLFGASGNALIGAARGTGTILNDDR